MKETIIYKVVSTSWGKEYISCSLGRPKEISPGFDYHPYSILYKINEPAIRKKGTGGIFVFNTLKDAIEFAGENILNGTWGILKCKTRCKLKPIRFRDALRSEISIRDFWHSVKNSIINHLEFMRVPEGTFLVNSLIPIEGVTNETRI